ncbi:MAG: NUDIX hydrolase [Pseudomonadales bacterium]
MSDELDWPLVESQGGEDLILFRARYDLRRHPLTREVMRRIVLDSVDWVNVVAIDRDGRLVMIRQFRFGVGYTTLEIPGGMVDAGETPLDAARRELREETGYAGGTWESLGAVEPNPAFHNHLCHQYLARDVERAGDQDLSGGEAIRVELMSPAAVGAAVRGGEIRHVLVLSALSRVFDLWPRPFGQPADVE